MRENVRHGGSDWIEDERRARGRFGLPGKSRYTATL